MSCCLIYKVHTALSGGSLSYHSSFSLSSTFFKFFQTFSRSHSQIVFCVKRRPRRQLINVTTLFFLCQHLFSSFFKLFKAFHRKLGGRCPRRQLIEDITFKTVCQALFSSFLNLLQGLTVPLFMSFPHRLYRRSFDVPRRKRLPIIADHWPLVNNFFPSFFTLFSPPISAQAFPFSPQYIP